jgi:hypothetical protein
MFSKLRSIQTETVAGNAVTCLGWNAVIEESAARDGTFRAVLREVSIEVVSRDPEHDLCRAVIRAGLADDPIQFWRSGVSSLTFHSVHRAAGQRIELGEKFPYRRVRRKEGAPSKRFETCSHVIADGQNDAGGYGPPSGAAYAH